MAPVTMLLIAQSLRGSAMVALATDLRLPSAAPADLRVERLLQGDALGIDTAEPLLSWSWRPANGVESSSGVGQPRGIQPPNSVHVTCAASAGQLDSHPFWNYRGEVGAVPSLLYRGPALRSHSRVHWRVCSGSGGKNPVAGDVWCATASFVTGIVKPRDWVAKWIRGRQLRSPELRLTGRNVSSAVVSVSGLGLVELMLNGAKVGDAELDPGFSTNYTERILYSTWDVTHMLNQGEKSVVCVV